MATRKSKVPGAQLGLPFDTPAQVEAAAPAVQKGPVASVLPLQAVEHEPTGDKPDTQLRAWDPAHWPVAPDWQPLVDRFLASPAAQRLGHFVQSRLDQGAVVYPPLPLRALALTPLHQVRVVIIGQDPYHGPGQAEGLSFSVPPSQMLPPSLRNIFQEITRSRQQHPEYMPAAPDARAERGSLLCWAKQGVLLLNSCLTVEQGQPNSHANQGWEALTMKVIGAVAESEQPVVFMLWGSHAQQRRDAIAESGAGKQHLVLIANHPSPLSALRPPMPFIGCDHFVEANRFLQSAGGELVRW